MVARGQLLELGFSASAIQHRLERGRLFVVHRGVYAVGRPSLAPEGAYMAAVLACGPSAVLSHGSAAAYRGLRRRDAGPIEVSVPDGSHRRRPGIRIHRRRRIEECDRELLDRIPVTSVSLTIVDIAPRLDPRQLDTVVNEADRLDLIPPAELLRSLQQLAGRPGVARLRAKLETLHHTATDSELERMFLRLCRDAGLPRPLTGARLNGFKVDFYWPDAGLLVETDGLRYHRNELDFSRDRRRDQAHAAAGLATLRFTHRQVAKEARYVRDTLLVVIRRLSDKRAADDGRIGAPEASGSSAAPRSGRRVMKTGA